MRLFAQDLTTDTLQHIAARGLSEAGGPKPLLLRVLVDLFVRRPTHSDEEIQHFAEIAHAILPCATRAEIDHAAERLCTYPAAPGELMDLLALRAPHSAVFLFEKCRRLSTPILQQAALSGTVPIACAIAKRDDLDIVTRDLLAARPEREIALALIENRSAPIPPHDLKNLVARACDDAEMAQALCHRLPHRPEVLSLFRHAKRSDRLIMIATARKMMPLPPAQISLDAACLSASAQNGLEDFAAALAAQIKWPQAETQKLVQERGGETLMIALRALDAQASLIETCLRALPLNLTEGQIAWRRGLACSVDQGTAQNILQTMWQGAHKPAQETDRQSA